MARPEPDKIRSEIGERFFLDGFLFPLDVFEPGTADGYREELERLEKRMAGLHAGNKNQLNFPHVLFRFANEMARDTRLLDVVEEILGPDILVWGSTFFIKEPRTESFVSWHQDLKYWGLSDEDGQVSAWIALNSVKRGNGCMQFLPGTHKWEMLNHRDTFAESNILTRGQEADFDLDEDAVVHCELEPGQASFHHGKVLHSSPANRSDRRRIGLAIQFIAPHVEQRVASRDFAMLVRGEDRYGHFELVEPPGEDLSDDALATHGRILAAQNEAMYEGADRPA